MRHFYLLPVLLVVLVFSLWIVNMIKLTRCDFVAPYKCEVVHGIGVVPPVALVTAWFGTDEGKAK